MNKPQKTIKSPLQMVGFYLAWVETTIAGSIWAIKGTEKWTLSLLVITIAAVAILYAGIVAFVLVYLTVKRPNLLFNPSDYADNVQPMLFNNSPLIVKNPPEQ